MTEHRNIELFDQVVAVTLLELYRQFPNPTDLQASSVACMIEDVKGEELFDLSAELSLNSLSFLSMEGFITYEPERRTLTGPEFPKARLTLKGLTLLGSVPASLERKSNQPFVDQFSEAIKSGAQGAVSDAVRSMFKAASLAGAQALGQF